MRTHRPPPPHTVGRTLARAGEFMTGSTNQGPPTALQFIAAQLRPVLVRVMPQRLWRFHQDWQDIASHQAARLEAIGSARAGELAQLRHLDSATRRRIQPTVVAAAQTLAVPGSWSGQVLMFIGRHEVAYALPAIVIGAMILANLIPGLPIPDGSLAQVGMLLMVAI